MRHAKEIYDELRKAADEHRPIPFAVKQGAITVLIESPRDLIAACEGFKIMAEDEATAELLGQGVMTR